MPLDNLADVEDQIQRVTDLEEYHREMAEAAEALEETAGDVSLETEEKSYQFTLIFEKLKRLFYIYSDLYHAGCLQPEALVLLQLQFHVHHAAETENTELYHRALALEELHDTENTRQEALLEDLEHHHATLLVIRDDLRLQAQGTQDTPLNLRF